MRYMTWSYLGLLTFWGTATVSLSAVEKPGPPAIVTVETQDFKVEFAGEQAWTIRRIFFQGDLVADATGFYGTVFAPQGGQWIGTGHTEGGVEKIEKVTLKVDGQPCPLTDQAVYRGSRAEIAKQSFLGPIRLEATYVVTDDCLLERHRYGFTEEVKVGTLYAFMHCWLARTTEWIAESTTGHFLEGTFDDSGDFELKEDVKWTAIYDPESRKAMLAWYPQPLTGQGIQTAYWDKTVYHKLYNQIFAQTTVAKGTTVEAVVILRGLEAKPEGWKETVQKAAEATRPLYERGEIGF